MDLFVLYYFAGAGTKARPGPHAPTERTAHLLSNVEMEQGREREEQGWGEQDWAWEGLGSVGTTSFPNLLPKPNLLTTATC